MSHPLLSLLTVFSLLFCAELSASAEKSVGQTIYVPAYSHIYFGNREHPLALSVTLSIRNIDPASEMVITSVTYYHTEGELLRQFVKTPVQLGPLGSARYVVGQDDNTGGSGANFIVKWQADKPINPPIVESVMIGTQSMLGISFTSRGEAIQ
ncbi:DUF3124 domain-containing protein [Desulforhopalus vacuolatus]|uniref:DUF3124 domain-containing protein n=1 Tax=Desulforhopalus vacuolatus TaxID=40414 RepID=UPI0019651D13|nr:DUF3124 domain-containing protein [Desulforhopalus vacuolatus]MBM9519281.1 DUF3124 domain-containing protein [Desulforhopalus vacuolatus]